MGDNPRPNRPVSVDEMQCIQTLLEEDWDVAISVGDVNLQMTAAVNAVTYVAGFVGGLRCEEIFKLDLTATERHRKRSLSHRRLPHITLGLRGRVKGETADRCHLLPLSLVTKSGLEVGEWVVRLLDLCGVKGWTKGALLRSCKGGRWVRGKIMDLDPMFHGYLLRVKKRWPEIITADDNPVALSSLYRSLRKGFTARARNMGVPQAVIESQNRWRRVDKARGKQLAMGMLEHYSDIVAILETLLQYSREMKRRVLTSGWSSIRSID